MCVFLNRRLLAQLEFNTPLAARTVYCFQGLFPKLICWTHYPYPVGICPKGDGCVHCLNSVLTRRSIFNIILCTCYFQDEDVCTMEAWIAEYPCAAFGIGWNSIFDTVNPHRRRKKAWHSLMWPNLSSTNTLKLAHL